MSHRYVRCHNRAGTAIGLSNPANNFHYKAWSWLGHSIFP